jgi:hypothetical protein
MDTVPGTVGFVLVRPSSQGGRRKREPGVNPGLPRQPSMSSRAYSRGGVLVPSEHHITEFHSWIGAQLNEVG